MKSNNLTLHKQSEYFEDGIGIIFYIKDSEQSNLPFIYEIGYDIINQSWYMYEPYREYPPYIKYNVNDCIIEDMLSHTDYTRIWNEINALKVKYESEQNSNEV